MSAVASTNGAGRPTRAPAIRDRVQIGQRWRRRRDDLEIRVYQIHRRDRLVEATLVSVRLSDTLRWQVRERVRWLIPFAELASQWVEQEGKR